MKLLAAAIPMFLIGVYLPIHETRVSVASSRLDEALPMYQWHEVHTIRIAASRERIDWAIRSVTVDEIHHYRTLTWMRRAFGPARPGILNPPAGRPILDTFTSGPFPLVADEPGRELLMFQSARRGEAGLTIGFDFRIDEVEAGQCLLTTETRIYAVGTHMRRGFAAYWRMIYPGSALIRREWLKAIQRRAVGETGHVVRS